MSNYRENIFISADGTISGMFPFLFPLPVFRLLIHIEDINELLTNAGDYGEPLLLCLFERLQRLMLVMSFRFLCGSRVSVEHYQRDR